MQKVQILFIIFFGILGINTKSFASSSSDLRYYSIRCEYYDTKNPSAPLNGPKFVNLEGKYLGNKIEQIVFFTNSFVTFNFLEEKCNEKIPEGHKLLQVKARIPGSDVLYTISNDREVFKINHKKGNMVIFSDSLSDEGNLQRKIHFLPRKHYFNGRFSNGPVWVEYLRQMLNNGPIQNNSYGGAKTSKRLVLKLFPLKEKLSEIGRTKVCGNYLHEISKYLKKNLVFDSTDISSNLYFIWVGANNYIEKIDWPTFFFHLVFSLDNDPEINLTIGLENEGSTPLPLIRDNDKNKNYHFEKLTDQVTDDIIKGINNLIKRGGRHFLVGGLPNIGKTPMIDLYKKSHFSADDLGNAYREIIIIHNRKLKEKIAQLQQKYSSLKIDFIDIDNTIFENFYANASFFGFKKNKFFKACYEGEVIDFANLGECQKPNEHFFWDQLHPATKSHCFIAWEFHKIIYHNGYTKIPPYRGNEIKEFCNKATSGEI